MKKEIEFGKKEASDMFMEIWNCFDNSERHFLIKDQPRNIRNVCAYTFAVLSLKMFGADVDAYGIYNDDGYDRIGYSRINTHEFIKNGKFNADELKAALLEIAEAE